MDRPPVGELKNQDLPKEVLESLLCTMWRIRWVEEKIVPLLEQRVIKAPAHLYTGQEAIAAGICAHLEKADYVFGGHRSHGHYLAKGGDLNKMVAELMGKVTGCSKGRGGSMHLYAPEAGVAGTVPLVAATVSLAAGGALAFKLRKEKSVTVSFFGDGAAEEGTTHESMNMAALYKLPVIFVCENNFFASHMSLLERRAKDNLVELAQAHGMPGVCVDGNDVTEVYAAGREAVERARSGGGPTFIEGRTYRWRGHVGPSMDVDVGVKRNNDVKEWMKADPIPRLKSLLLKKGTAEAALDQIERKTSDEVDGAIEFGRQSPYPEASEVLSHVFFTGGTQ